MTKINKSFNETKIHFYQLYEFQCGKKYITVLSHLFSEVKRIIDNLFSFFILDKRNLESTAFATKRTDEKKINIFQLYHSGRRTIDQIITFPL